MGKKWQTTKIEGISKSLAMGPFGSDIKTDNFVPSGVPVIRGGNLTSGRFNGSEFVYLTEDKADRLRTANAFPDDIVFTHRGTLGQVGIVPKSPFPRYVVSQSQMKLTCRRDVVEPMFVYYFFRSPQGQHALLMNTSQTGVPAISRPLTSLKQIEMPLPPLSEQNAIADILGSLDDKIELNRRTNETLEAMARALFKSWFVDFDPVVAKSKGRQPDGMDAETVKLFPSSFVDSEIGRVPKGWMPQPLTNLIEVNPNRKLAKGVVAPYLDMGGLPTHSARTNPTIERAFSSGSKFTNGDTLVARITPCLENGKTGFVDGLAEGQVAWGSTEFIVLRPNPPIPPPYAYFLARTEEFRSFAIANMTGTSGRQRVVVDSLSHLMLPSPAADIARAFGDFASAVLVQMKAIDTEMATLAVVRDCLLPRLLSGEINLDALKRRAGDYL